MQYAVGFLVNTNNFDGVQQVFEAQINPDKGLMLNVKQDVILEGSVVAENMLVILNKGKLTIGSDNPYYIAPTNPIRKLEEIVLNPYLTKVKTNFKLQYAESVISKFHLNVEEKFTKSGYKFIYFFVIYVFLM